MTVPSAQFAMSYARRKWADRLATALAASAVAFAVVPALLLVAYVLSRGAGALSWAFFTELPKPMGERGGGMANAIVGTAELVFLASAMGIPLGIIAGVYLSEHRTTTFARAVRFSADVLAGIPSILVGVVVYATLVVRIGHFSAFSGAVALAILMVPLIARITDELARTVPSSLREAALALGASRWRIVTNVVLPTIARGLRVGIMLAIARVCGETAPLLFTAFNNRFWSESLSDPTSTLQVQIFTYTMSPHDDWHAQAWAAALVLMAFVAALSVGARAIGARPG